MQELLLNLLNALRMRHAMARIINYNRSKSRTTCPSEDEHTFLESKARIVLLKIMIWQRWFQRENAALILGIDISYIDNLLDCRHHISLQTCQIIFQTGIKLKLARDLKQDVTDNNAVSKDPNFEYTQFLHKLGIHYKIDLAALTKQVQLKMEHENARRESTAIETV